jgi:hypothetical protein
MRESTATNRDGTAKLRRVVDLPYSQCHFRERKTVLALLAQDAHDAA